MSRPLEFKQVFNSATLLALCVLLTGCMSFNPRSLRGMESALRDSNPDIEFESTTRFGVGALTLDLVDFAFVHDSRIDISKISRADIGIYEVAGDFDLSAFQMPEGTQDRSCPQRDVILRIREDDEHVEMAVCSRNGKLIGFTIFTLEPQEFVVINTRGDIPALVSAAIRGQGRSRREAAGAWSGMDAEPGGVHKDVHRHVDIHTSDGTVTAAASPRS